MKKKKIQKKEKISLVVLAAGKGTRLGESGEIYTKPGVPLLGKPLLYHVIKPYTVLGVKEVILVLSSDSWYLTGLMKRAYPLIKFKPVLQKKHLGSANALSVARKYIQSEHFFLTACDNVIPLRDIDKLSRFHFERESDITLSIMRLGKKSLTKGSTVTMDPQNRVIKIVEKPSEKQLRGKMGVAFCHIYHSRTLKTLKLNVLGKKGEFDLMTELAQKVKDLKIHGARISTRLDITYPKDLIKASIRMKKPGVFAL